MCKGEVWGWAERTKFGAGRKGLKGLGEGRSSVWEMSLSAQLSNSASSVEAAGGDHIPARQIQVPRCWFLWCTW
jgi:hypothetical protein